MNNGFADFDFKLLLYVISMAILGGIVGTKLNRKASEQLIKNIFNLSVLGIILLNVYNAIMLVFWGIRMKYFSTLIKPASSLCNMRCKYCFYHDVAQQRDCFSYGIMSDDVMKSIIARVFDYFQEETMITFAFQGGEPTIAGIQYFKRFVAYVNEKKKDVHHINYSIQTNGLLLNHEWYDFLYENNFLVGVSLDGFQENHDDLRLDVNNQKTHDIIMNHIKEMKNRNIQFNILTVLTSQLSKQAKQLFDFYLQHDLNNIQIIPCLPEFGNKENIYACSPKMYFHFYDELFKEWFKYLQEGRYISINYFESLILLFKGIPPTQCGFLGYCNMQFVIESDGSVYPCDFYCLDEYKVGNILENSILELAKSNVVKTFIKEKKTLSKLCTSCRYFKMCYGNCKRLSICYYDNNSCALQKLMSKYERQLIWLSQNI